MLTVTERVETSISESGISFCDILFNRAPFILNNKYNVIVSFPKEYDTSVLQF